MALKLGELTVDIGADTSDLKRAGKEVNKTASGMEKSFKRVGSAIVAALSFQATKSVILLADSMNMLDARIRNITKSAKDFEIVRKGIRDIAIETGSSIQSVSTLAQQLLIAAESIGATSNQVVQMTSNLNKLGAIGGSSAEQMGNAMLQFGQAMAGGIVRAEEFNSILENTPLIARAIGQGLGLTVGELRKAVIAGKLLSKDVFKALESQTKKINKQFENMPLTVQRASGTIKNVLAITIQKLDKASGVTKGLAKEINDLATELLAFINDDKKFNDALEVTKDLISAIALVLVSRLGVAFSSVTQKIVANTIAARASSVESLKLVASNVALTSSALAAAKAEQVFALSLFNAAKGTVNAKKSFDRLTASNIALAAASKNAATASATFAKTATITSRSITALTKAGKGLLAIFGGIPGLIFTVVTSLILFVDWETKSEKQTKRTSDAYDAQSESLKGLDKTQRSIVKNKLLDEQRRIETQIKITNGTLDVLREKLDNAFKPGIDGRTPASTPGFINQIGVLTNEANAELTELSSKLKLVEAGLLDIKLAGRGEKDGEDDKPATNILIGGNALDKEISRLMELIETYDLSTEALNLFNSKKLIELERSKLSKKATEEEIQAFQRRAKTILSLTKMLNQKLAIEKKKADDKELERERQKAEQLKAIQLRQEQDFATSLGTIFGMEKEAAIVSATLGLQSAIAKAFAQKGSLAFGDVAVITAQFANLFSTIKSLKGPGRQAGGNVSQGVLHPVNENGQPELLIQGSKQFLLSGQSGGQIIPATSMRGGGGGGLNVTVNNNAPDLVAVSEPFITQGELMIQIDRAVVQAVDQVNTSLASGRGESSDSLRTGFNLTRNI